MWARYDESSSNMLRGCAEWVGRRRREDGKVQCTGSWSCCLRYAAKGAIKEWHK